MLFEKALKLHLLLAALSGLILLFVIGQSESIHISFLAIVLLSAGLGVLQPRKGWMLALVQIGVILIGYFLLKNNQSLMPSKVAEFCTYVSPFPTLVGSFMGAFIKRALS